MFALMLTAILVTAGLCLGLIPLARKVGLLDHPGERKPGTCSNSWAAISSTMNQITNITKTKTPLRILVTGGAGYIGSHACIELLNAGYKVVVIDNLSNSKSDSLSRVEELTGKDIQFHLADLCDAEAVDLLFRQEQIDAVIHFAGLKAVGESVQFPLKYYQNNVGGTANLLESMNKHGVKNIVFSSSCTVYGAPETLPLREDFPLLAVNPYGQTKLSIEYMLKDLASLRSGLEHLDPALLQPGGRARQW